MGLPKRSSSKLKAEAGNARFEKILQLLLLASVTLNIICFSREASVPHREGLSSPILKLEESQPRDNKTELFDVVLHAFGDSVHRKQTDALEPPPELSNAEISAKLTIDGESCETEELRNLVKYLHNIVLIININYDDVGRKTAGFLRQVYGRFFDHVVLIGPNSVPEVEIEARGHSGLRELWPYAYFHLPAIFARFPKAEGFLWTNDDVVINYWNLLHADKTKLWLPVTPECPSCNHFVPFQAGISEDVVDGWSAHPGTRLKSNRALAATDLKYILQYKDSILPRTEGYMKQVVDSFYIPRRLVAPLIGDLIPVYRDHRIPSEIAIPMMFNSLEHPSTYDEIFRKMVYRWERGPLYDPRKYWNDTLGAYHHWKLASPVSQQMFLGSLGERDKCLRNITVVGTTGSSSQGEGNIIKSE